MLSKYQVWITWDVFLYTYTIKYYITIQWFLSEDVYHPLNQSPYWISNEIETWIYHLSTCYSLSQHHRIVQYRNEYFNTNNLLYLWLLCRCWGNMASYNFMFQFCFDCFILPRGTPVSGLGGKSVNRNNYSFPMPIVYNLGRKYFHVAGFMVILVQ